MKFPVVLGGDCTIVLGLMLALRRRGRYGLFFIDGNADFFQPDAEPNGEGASMDLAFVTGYGPLLLTDIEGRSPLVRREDAVAFAFRDHEDQAKFGSQPLPARQLTTWCCGVGRLLHPSGRRLSRRCHHAGGDFRVPGGLLWDELGAALRIVLASGRVVGIEVTIYNPHLDEAAAPVVAWSMHWPQRSGRPHSM